MIENIKQLYKEVEGKNKFIGVVANEFNLKPTSIRTHWFGNFWSIPESKQSKVVELLQNQIKNQNN